MSVFRFATLELAGSALWAAFHASSDKLGLLQAEMIPHLPAGWEWVLSVSAFLVCAAGLWLLLRPGKSAAGSAEPYALPTECTRFNVLTLLRAMEQDARLNLPPASRAELAAAIHELESCCFPPASESSPDLERLAREWVTRAKWP